MPPRSLDVDARVEHEVVRVLDGGDPLRVGVRVDERGPVRVVGVLEVEPDRPGREHARGQLAAGEAVAGLHVGGHGHGDGARDALHGREHLAGGRLLPVGVAEGFGYAAARGGHGREARPLDEPGAAGVPGVGQHERPAGDMERAQRRGAHVASRTAIVIRTSAHRRPPSSESSTSHTQVVRPR